MEIRENDEICIFAPLSPRLGLRESARLLENIKSETRKIALDLSYVQDCTIEFIEGLKEIAKTEKIGVFNIPSDIFVLFNIMKLDTCANLFVSENDFEENARQLVNRQFRCV